MITTVLFDLDGTIVDTNELIIQTFLHVFQEHVQDGGVDGKEGNPRDILGDVSGRIDKRTVTREHIISHMGKPLSEQLSILSGRELVDDLVQMYREFNIKKHDELVREFPYVKEVISKLHMNGIRMGIVTTKMRNTTMMGLKMCGLDMYMDAIVTLEDVEHAKPHPEPVQRAMQALRADPQSTVMVGDSRYDIEAANAAGVISVGVAWSLKGEDHLREFHPAHIIQDMRELLPIVGIN